MTQHNKSYIESISFDKGTREILQEMQTPSSPYFVSVNRSEVVRLAILLMKEAKETNPSLLGKLIAKYRHVAKYLREEKAAYSTPRNILIVVVAVMAAMLLIAIVIALVTSGQA